MRRRELIAGTSAAASAAVCQFNLVYAQGVGAVTHRTVQANGINLHLAEMGEGPLVVMCHGFPECWYSWRHQLAALSAAGYHAVAPDMRGYGRSDRPEAVDRYTLLHLVGDMVGLLDALGSEQAVIAGHDWGAPVAWHAALLRPDRFRAVIALSVPFVPRSPVVPTSVMPHREDAIFYQLYFQQLRMAEAELERDVRQAFVELLGNPSAGTVVASNKRTSRSLSPRGLWNSQEREVARKCRDPDRLLGAERHPLAIRARGRPGMQRVLAHR